MKKHTLMKIVSAAMACVMAFSLIAGTGITASAATSAQKEAAMKSALTKVKLRVDIPERISEFRYSTDRNYSTDCYHFTWSTPENGSVKVHESIAVNIVEDVITSYSYSKYYDNKEDDPDYNRKQSFAKLSDSQMTAKAKEHMKMLNPDFYSEADYRVNNISLFGNTATVNFDRMKNGIAVDGNGGSVTINKDTGELYSCSVTWFEKETAFADASKRLTRAQAIESYKKLCTLSPAYTISYDWKTDTREAVLVYRPDFVGEIDAFTGKPSTIWDDMKKDGGYRNPPWSWSNSYHYTNTAVAGVSADLAEDDCDDVDSGEGVSFTEAELREIDTAKGLLTKEEVTKLLQQDKFVDLPSWVMLDSSRLYKDEATEEYFYSMRYKNNDAAKDDDDGIMPIKERRYYYTNVTVNAKTGKITEFSRSYENNLDDTAKYPVASNVKKADEAAAYFYPEVYKEYKAAEDNTAPSRVQYYDGRDVDDEEDLSEIEKNPATGDANGKPHYETVRTFRYDRYVNGVIVEGDSISITIDNKGNVYSVNGRHTDVKFPPVPKFDNDKAFEQLFRQQDLMLYYDGYYKKDGTIKTYLIFNVNSFTLDSKYRLVNYNGKVIEKAAESDTDYIDIKGSKYEKAITTLARYGITLPSENGEFKPNATITDKEFAIIVYGALKSYVPYNIKNGGFGGESKPVALTNAEAAKVFVTAEGGAEYAELKGIYKAPYNDVPASNKYVGYISIAKAKGYMKGEGGKFSPNTKISRGKAMQIVYDYINSLK